MKKITKLFASIISLAVLFVSCTGITDDVTVYDNNNDPRNVTITVTSSEQYVTFESKTDDAEPRSILPNALTANSLTYYLFGTDNVSGATISPETIAFTKKGTSTTEGTVSRTFNKSSYTLTLVALDAEHSTAALIGATPNTTNLLKYAALVAYADVDFRYNETVSFYLTPNKTSGAPGGKVSLKISALGWKPSDFSDYKIKAAGLYKLSNETTTADYPSATGTGRIVADGVISLIPESTPSEANFIPSSDIPYGTYNFTIYFEDNYGHKAEYSEDIVVLNNQTTSKEVKILPVIGKKPAQPASFNAGYIDPKSSEEDISTAEYYKVEYQWSDSSNNETYFELETLQILGEEIDLSKYNSGKGWKSGEWDAFKNSLTSANYVSKIYNNKGGNITYAGTPTQTVKYDAADENYISGKLVKNNHTLTMKYALGTRYIARIRAVNDNGESDWTYVDFTGGTFEDGGTNFPTTTTSINRYKLAYNLNGGKWALNGTTEPDLITFLSQDPTTSGGAVILEPKEDETDPKAKLELYLETSGTKNYWIQWLKADDSSYNNEGAAPAKYKGFSNLSLFASYNATTTADVTIYNIADNEIKDSMISLATKVDKSADTEKTVTITNKSAVVDISQNKYLLFKLTSATIKYDMVKVGLKKTNGTINWLSDSCIQDDTGVATIGKDISSLTTGYYLITFYAYSSRNSTPYSYWVSMEITESGSSTPATPTYFIGTSSVSASLEADGKTIKSTVTDPATTMAYQWFYNTTDSTTGGTSISGATVSPYDASTTAGLTSGSTYYFYVTVTDNNSTPKTITSNTVAYTVPVALVGLAGTETVTATYTSPNLTTDAGTVLASVTKPLTYTWYYNSTSSNTGGTALGVTTATVNDTAIATALTAAANGTYYFYCEISDGTTTVTTSATASGYTKA